MMTGGVLHSHATIHFSFAPFNIKPGIMTTFSSPSFHSVSHRVLAFLMFVIVLAKMLAKKEIVMHPAMSTAQPRRAQTLFTSPSS